MTAQADTTARLTRAERVLTCTVLAPFVMILPTVLVLVRFDHGETAWEAVYRFAVVPVAAVGLVLVVPLVFAFQSFGIHAYRFDRDEVATLPVDWTAPGWARIRAAVAGTGRDLAGVPAVSTIAVKANLRVVHRTRQMPGRWGRWSDWSVARLKVFAITGAVVGILAGVLNEVRPGWFDVPYFRRGTPLIARGADNHHLFVLRSGAADVRDQEDYANPRSGQRNSCPEILRNLATRRIR